MLIFSGVGGVLVLSGNSGIGVGGIWCWSCLILRLSGVESAGIGVVWYLGCLVLKLSTSELSSVDLSGNLHVINCLCTSVTKHSTRMCQIVLCANHRHHCYHRRHYQFHYSWLVRCL